MKIFKVDAFTYMMGPDGPSCQATYLEKYYGDEDAVRDFGEAQEISAERMATLLVQDEETGEHCTFQQQFNEMLKYPCWASDPNACLFFATSEY